MRNPRANDALRQYVREFLVPTATQRSQISEIYAAIKFCLGEARCIQIGSYARETAIRPPHDLDVLFTTGKWAGSAPDSAVTLRDVQSALQRGFKNPTPYELTITVQTHSVTLGFVSRDDEVFAVDIVPALEDGKNEFDDPTYRVPELVRFGHTARRQFELDVKRGTRAVNWIKSDPRGYTTAGKILHQDNSDFRPSTRFIKGWRASVKRRRPDFALKAFHAEQVIAGLVGTNVRVEIGEIVAVFIERLPATMSHPQIADRADNRVFMDEYLRSLTTAQRSEVVKEGRELVRKLQSVANIAEIDAVLGNRPSSASPISGAPAIVTSSTAPSLIQNPARPWAL